MRIKVVGQGRAESLRLPRDLKGDGISGIAAHRRNRCARIQVLVTRENIPLRVGIALSERRNGKHKYCDQRCQTGDQPSARAGGADYHRILQNESFEICSFSGCTRSQTCLNQTCLKRYAARETCQEFVEYERPDWEPRILPHRCRSRKRRLGSIARRGNPAMRFRLKLKFPAGSPRLACPSKFAKVSP